MKAADKKPTVVTMADINHNELFICIGVGVLRKTHPCQGTNKAGDKINVIYPNEMVLRLAKRGG